MTKKYDERPWGNYTVLADEKDHKVKRIVVLQGKRLSLQSHLKRSEHWFIISGKAQLTLDDKEIELGQNEYADIPAETRHRIKNIGKSDLVFVEIQTGSYFGEDDIERFEDDFGRV